MKSSEKFNFEASIKELENIVKALENPDTGLDNSIELYKRGIDLLNKCSKKLEETKLEITKITKKE